MAQSVRERQTLLAPAVLLAGAAVAFLGGRGDLLRPRLFLALVVGGALAAVAVRRPDVAGPVGLGVVLVVPVYWAQPLPGVAVAGTASLLVSLALLPAAWRERHAVRLHALDALVALHFGVTVVSLAVNASGKGAAIGSLVARAALPYVVFRLLSTRPGAGRRLAIGLAAAAVPLAIIGIREAGGTENPFFTLVRAGVEHQWVRSQVRFGEVRAEASFGHAIAFSLFLAVALLLLLGLAWQRRGHRLLLVALAAPLGAALLATGSRGGLVCLVVGFGLWALGLRERRGGLLVVGWIVLAALLLTPAGGQLTRLQRSITDSGEAGEAARYRLEIASLLVDGDNFTVLGQEAPPGLGVVSAAEQRLGIRTIDSQYAVVYVTYGLFALASFVALAVALVRSSLRRHLQPIDRAWAAATAAVAIALSTVALFTQMQSLFWIAVALTATAATTDG